MAKKYEFKPDSDRKDLLQRLYMTPQQRRSLLKWVLYGLLLIALSILQDVFLTHLRILGATTDLVPCGIFLICVIEGTHSGSIFSLVASLFYLFSVDGLGPYIIIFITFLAIVVTAFRQGYLRKGFAAALLCVGAAMLIYEFLLFAFALFLQYTTFSRIIGFLLTAAMSIAAAPLIYFPAKAINALGGDAWKE